MHSGKSAACTIVTNDAPPDVTSAAAPSASVANDRRPNVRPARTLRPGNHRDQWGDHSRAVARVTGKSAAPVLARTGAAPPGEIMAHAFIYQDAVFTDLGALPGNSNQAYAVGYAINSSGMIVGDSKDGAFIYKDGVMRLLKRLSARLAYSVNDAGDVGVGSEVRPTTLDLRAFAPPAAPLKAPAPTVAPPPASEDAVAQCGDGLFVYVATGSRTCAGHGGVAKWLKTER
jgi:hypothetical protein